MVVIHSITLLMFNPFNLSFSLTCLTIFTTTCPNELNYIFLHKCALKYTHDVQRLLKQHMFSYIQKYPSHH